MGRKQYFSVRGFEDAALKIAAERGPAAVTIAAVAKEAGAPVGSVYHRFSSRDQLLAQMWLRIVSSFQDEFLEKLETGDGLEAALHTPRWVRLHPMESRILLLYRREELIESGWSDELRDRALRIKDDLDTGIRNYAARISGRSGTDATARVLFALIDAPKAAVVRYIRQNTEPPEELDEYIKTVFSTILRKNKEKRPT
jgi:AcrR family transcriptional regulator